MAQLNQIRVKDVKIIGSDWPSGVYGGYALFMVTGFRYEQQVRVWHRALSNHTRNVS
jgi:hypothetical protein